MVGLVIRYILVSIMLFLLIGLIAAVVMLVNVSGEKQDEKPVSEVTADKDGITADKNDITADENKNEVQREKLAEEECIRSDQVIDDRLGWLSNTETVKKEMDYFYKESGVQPYLLICDRLDGKGGEITDEEAENYLQGMYNTLYDDEGHMIFVFMEYAESEYVTFLYTGEAADRVIDEDAREIILNNADRFYTDSNLSDDEYFAKIFRISAENIMDSL